MPDRAVLQPESSDEIFGWMAPVENVGVTRQCVLVCAGLAIVLSAFVMKGASFLEGSMHPLFSKYREPNWGQIETPNSKRWV